MNRRDFPTALLATTAGAALTATRVQAQTAPSSDLVYPGDVTRYGADKTGGTPCDGAITAALAANAVVYFPAGVYRVNGPIVVQASRSILGPRGGSHANQAALIWHTPSAAGTNLFELTGDFGDGSSIANLHMTGGNGGFFIRSNRQQSVFENLRMEGVVIGGVTRTVDANGILLTACECAGDPPANYNYGSWDVTIRGCKWVARGGSNYRGYVVSSSGGRVSVDNCVAERGAIGVDVDRVEALVISGFQAHNQNYDNAQQYGSSPRCGIRLSGSGPKRAISINSSYIEGCENGIWADNVEGLDIANSYFDDNGYGGNAIKLANSSVSGATIRNCSVLHRSTRLDAAAIDNAASKALLTATTIRQFTAGVVALKTTAPLNMLTNTIASDAVIDSGGNIFDMECRDVDLVLNVSSSDASGSFPIAGQQCSYTRVGRRVWVDIDITFATVAAGSGSGYLCIRGLPFAKRNATLPVGAAQLHAVAFTGFVSLGFATSATDQTLCLYQSSSNGGIQALPASSVSSGDRIMGSISYRI